MQPFELRFQPTRGEYVQRMMAGLGSAAVYVLAFVLLKVGADVWFFCAKGWSPSMSSIALAAALLVAVAAVEWNVRRLRVSGIQVTLGEAGVRVAQAGRVEQHGWSGMQIRHTPTAYVLVSGRLAILLPRRVLDPERKQALEAWLSARSVPEQKKSGPTVSKALVVVGLILAFVTFYNLFQPSPHARPRRATPAAQEP